MPPEAPAMDDVLRRAVAGIADEDVQYFYRYFEEMKAYVRSYLRRKAHIVPGVTAVAHSALVSLLNDVASAQVPLGDVDEDGYPALWLLLLKYLERHCNKWNQRCKRQGREVSLNCAAIPIPPDPDGNESVDSAIENLLEVLQETATPRQLQIIELLIRGCTQAEIANELYCSEATVSVEKKKIRRLLETAGVGSLSSGAREKRRID